MAVQNIEYYRQQDGRDILKVTFNPTKSVSTGVTYVDACFEDLVKMYKWNISPKGYITISLGSKYNRRTCYLHTEIAFRYF